MKTEGKVLDYVCGVCFNEWEKEYAVQTEYNHACCALCAFPLLPTVKDELPTPPRPIYVETHWSFEIN